MQTTLGQFIGADDIGIHTVHFTNEKSKADVVLVHGFAEHSFRYLHVARRLVQGGYAVHALDQRGHGRSGGRRGVIPDIFALCADVEKFAGDVAAGNGTRPRGRRLFLLGHSMGGMIVLMVLARHRIAVGGAIATGPNIVPAVEVNPILIKLSPVIARLLPMVPVVRLESKDISRDPAVVRDYEEDPFVYHGMIDARTGDQLLNAANWLRANLGKIDQPVLLMHGTADRLTSPAGSELAHQQVASRDKKLVTYDGLYHEIMNEPEKERVLADMVAWLDAHV